VSNRPEDDALEPAATGVPASSEAAPGTTPDVPSGAGGEGDPNVDGLLAAALRALADPAGDDPEQAYQSGLRPLRERPEAAVRAAAARYDDLDEQRYLDRWGVLQVLTDLRVPAATRLFRDAIARPIPPEQSPDPAHGISTVGEEIILRTTAVEGLARIAADGDAPAKDALVELLEHPAFSVRRAAVQAITDSGDAELAERTRRRLEGTADEGLLSIRRAAVQDVPQAQGGRFLTDGGTPPPAPPRG
jgi:HEAT repeat protein